MAIVFLAGSLPLLQDSWLSVWTAHYTSAAHHDLFYIGIYSILGFAAFAFFLLHHAMLSIKGLEVSNRVHTSVIDTIRRMKIQALNMLPTGRIVQRLSRDISTLERFFPKTLKEFSLIVIKISFTVCIIVGSIWQTVFLIPLLAAIAWKVGSMRNTLFTELKRLNAVTRSRFYHLLDECLSDISVITTLNKKEHFTKRLFCYFDDMQRVTFAESGLCWGFYFFSQLVVAALIGGIVAGVLLFFGANVLSTSLAGLLVKFSLDISRQVRGAIEGWGNAESRITALERLEQLQEIPTEADLDSALPNDWPQQGKLEIRNLTARYAPHLPTVLHGVHVHIAAGEKVGIIGRTGAGKSSFCQAILGGLEVEGSIHLDGIDVTQYSPESVREKVTVIPQLPFLLPGTLRTQVDPEGTHSDREIVTVLEKVCFTLRCASDGLHTSVDSLLSQLSVGQMQLLAFARTLLARPKFVLLDEATASVDTETDRRLQKCMFEELPGATIITVAHRLETVKNYDRILEIRNGTVKES